VLPNPSFHRTSVPLALALNRNAGDKNEEANSLRLIADAAFKSEDFKLRSNPMMMRSARRLG